jgi:hypothetical protein
MMNGCLKKVAQSLGFSLQDAAWDTQKKNKEKKYI